VALELLCSVLRINCDFSLARVIAIAAKRTINPLVSPGTSDFQMNATFCRCVFERSISLEQVDINEVTRGHDASGEAIGE
jgi:hypothetical protein